MKIKICGMKSNLAEVAQLQPDYLGFIFYEGSPRFYERENIEELPEKTKKVGVFVNAEIGNILAKIKQFGLNIIQLHGNESANYCSRLSEKLANFSENRTNSPINAETKPIEVDTEPVEVSCTELVEVWKVFSIKDTFDFSVLRSYEAYVDKFLFDTKGKNKGGNGYTFDWQVLKDYPSKKEFILSGGIGSNEISKLRELAKTDLPLHGIDVNSKFETQPGLKDVALLRKFKSDLNVG